MAKAKKKETLSLEEKLEQALVPVDEQPYEVPKNWCWVRFENIMHNCDYIRIPLSIKERSTLEKIYDYYGASGVIDKVDRYLFDGTRLLIGEDGANLLSLFRVLLFEKVFISLLRSLRNILPKNMERRSASLSITLLS